MGVEIVKLTVMENKKIKEVLVDQGYISQEDMRRAEESGGDPIDFLLDQKILTKDIFGQAMAEHYKVKYANLAKIKIDEDVLRIIPKSMAQAKKVIVFGEEDEKIRIGMFNPDDLETKHNIEKKTGRSASVFYITETDLKSSLELYKRSIGEKFGNILSKLKDKTISKEESDELTIKMVDELLNYAEQSKASDIHIEPQLSIVKVRFRVDGVMREVLELPKNLHELILSRIKIMAKMRIDEHQAAQDGKFRFKSESGLLDVRVSIVPIVEGENVVMRLLSASSRKFDLETLGFSKSNLKIIRRVIKSPHGMVLVTGPTGSGKTTTLYAFLKILNNPNIHVSTIEDPVEYDIEGVSQIQVNSKTNLTFAKGLRAIVRQDPDIIMVGEIRDKETAGIAVNSALTGHLVLSTLHTNDAATTLPRLIDMKIEPFLVASTVNVIVAQRLIRKICEKCRFSYQLDNESEKILKREVHLYDLLKSKKQAGAQGINFYKGAGCKICGNTGYLGRSGIFEVLEMSMEIKELVIGQATSDEITRKAQEQGMKSMIEDGLEKALSGVTTLEEVMRVTKE